MTPASRWANAVAPAGTRGHRATEDPDLGHRRRRGRGRAVLEDGVDRGVVERVEEQRAMAPRGPGFSASLSIS